MKGQWLGNYSNICSEIEADGQVIVNIDELESNYRGVINIIPTKYEKIPISIGYFETLDKGFEQSIKIKSKAINPITLMEGSWDSIKSSYPKETFFSESIDAKLTFKNNSLKIEASTKEGISLQTTLSQPNHAEESRITGKKMSWNDFKRYVTELPRDTYFFRGQKKAWKLQTSFHRRERYCLDNYIKFDVQKLHKRLSSLTQHYFDLSVPDQNGAFFNLLQHHGYPTPLLDWSHSPYVSAFFSFRDWPLGYTGNENIRIYIFNSKAWQVFEQFQILNPPFSHLSIMDFISVDNPRPVPQQATTTVTNISDIEHYLLNKGIQANIDFIDAIDIPASERENAMLDLQYMGITAGSMFPGIDGACEEMREKYFNK